MLVIIISVPSAMCLVVGLSLSFAVPGAMLFKFNKVGEQRWWYKGAVCT